MSSHLHNSRGAPVTHLASRPCILDLFLLAWGTNKRLAIIWYYESYLPLPTVCFIFQNLRVFHKTGSVIKCIYSRHRLEESRAFSFSQISSHNSIKSDLVGVKTILGLSYVTIFVPWNCRWLTGYQICPVHIVLVLQVERQVQSGKQGRKASKVERGGRPVGLENDYNV